MLKHFKSRHSEIAIGRSDGAVTSVVSIDGNNKLRRIILNPHVMFKLFTRGSDTLQFGIEGISFSPSELEYVNSYYDDELGFVIIVTHESFDPLDVGDVIPVLQAIVTATPR